MNYFIIAGEASGDIHGAALMASIKQEDPEAQFQFLGGDLMAHEAGAQPLIHFRDMAYMGFVDVILHLPTILGFMKTAKQAIMQRRPDALILIDYPSFNLKMAKFAHQQGIPCFYFISPKVWAWKEYRVKDIKRYITRLFSILPFETEFFRRHNYEVEYVGNPTVKEIAEAEKKFGSFEEFTAAHSLHPDKPIIALVPGSRRSEIRENLPVMATAALRHPDHQLVIAGAPSILPDLYDEVLRPLGAKIPPIYGHSFELIHHAKVALVTSGTATLETAILHTPQVACYRMNGRKWTYDIYRHMIKGKYVTLPNLITNQLVIPELLLHFCTPDAVDCHLSALLVDSPQRREMLSNYQLVSQILTNKDCTATTAHSIVKYLNKEL